MVESDGAGELDRRAALATLGGEALGDRPLLWLLREALQQYADAGRDALKGPIRDVMAPRVPMPFLIGRRFALNTSVTSAIRREPVRRYEVADQLRTAAGEGSHSAVRLQSRQLDVANGSLKLWGACRYDADLAVSVLDTIERHTVLVLDPAPLLAECAKS